jgi:hypothetical protein
MDIVIGGDEMMDENDLLKYIDVLPVRGCVVRAMAILAAVVLISAITRMILAGGSLHWSLP